MAWEIEASEQATEWLEGLDSDSFAKIAAAIDELEERGPSLGRPCVERITSSRHHNMKELRSIGQYLRILFAFDPTRTAILLIAGDKTGNWTRWYTTNVPLADDLYDRHLKGEQI
jgi:hypothetical protein